MTTLRALLVGSSLLAPRAFAGEPEPALPEDPWSLVRVDVPGYPGALTSSATGSVLLAPPPPGTPWRVEAVGETDAVATEAVAVTNADLWHADGARGQGVSIAVFDIGWFAGETDPGELGAYETHDCTAHPSCEVAFDPWRPTYAWEDGGHGFGCAEVIRDLAPDAELHLVRVNSYTDFENAAAWAIRAGVDIVSMSLSFYNTSFYDGSGPFAAAIADMEAADVLLVKSAGNDARAHWEGRFLDGDGDGRMDLDGDNGLDVWMEAGSRTVYVAWDQFGRCGDTDLDVFVYDAEGALVGSSRGDQLRDGDTCEPVERVRAFASEDGWYRLEVVLRSGSTTALDVDLIGRGGTSFWESVAEGSVADPAADPLVVAVGAVRAEGYLDNDLESFSSRGPTGAGLAKPDIAGPDGLSTATMGPLGFYGTSASTPAVAALIAVVMSEDPSLTPRQAFRKLQGWALDGAPAFSEPDLRWGAGKARLPARDAGPAPCGRRPLVMPLLFVPVWWTRRRRTGAHGPADRC